MSGERRVLLGKIVGVFGVKGWVKLQSHTEPREALLAYRPWLLRQRGSVRAALIGVTAALALSALVILVKFEPSALMTYISPTPSLDDEKAISVPSGDQSGWKSFAA